MVTGRNLSRQVTRNIRNRQGAAQRPVFWAGTITALAAPHVTVKPDGATTAMDQLIAYPKGATPAVNDRVVGCWVDGEPFILAIVNA